MSTTYPKVSGCSACLVAAIEHRDEASVRRMLADKSVQYEDTVWLPLIYHQLISPLTGISSNKLLSPFDPIEQVSFNGLFQYTFVSCIVANNRRVGVNQCPHPVAIETLEVGEEPKSCVISVVLMAMLFSTPNFNALQILIESGRFDLREPLVFHLCLCYNSDFEKWKIIVVSTLGMAILIDRYNYKFNRAECSFLLTRSLLNASMASLDDVFIGFHWHNKYEWSSFRARGPIAFLINCTSWCFYLFKPAVLYPAASSTCALIEFLCRVGFEFSSPVHNYAKGYYALLQERCKWSNVSSFTVMDTLVSIFMNDLFGVDYFWQNTWCEYSIIQLLRMGLIFPERGGRGLSVNLIVLHNVSEDVATKSLRIIRQLLALGLFREPEFRATFDPRLSWARRCLYNGTDFTNIPCAICRTGNLIINTEECPIVAPLVSEFLSGPLTLLQLARIEIRRLIGVRHFERGINTLKRQLPPLVFRYISRADEMLSENPNELIQ